MAAGTAVVRPGSGDIRGTPVIQGEQETHDGHSSLVEGLMGRLGGYSRGKERKTFNDPREMW